MVGTSDTAAMSPASSALLTSATSKRGSSRTGPPKRTLRIRIERPPTWNSGMQASQRSRDDGTEALSGGLRAGDEVRPAQAGALGATGRAGGEEHGERRVFVRGAALPRQLAARRGQCLEPRRDGRRCSAGHLPRRASASRGSPASPSSQSTRASASCCASSPAVSRRLSGSTARPASAIGVEPGSRNSASPSSSSAIGASPGGAVERTYAAPRRARSRRSAKVHVPAAVSSAGASRSAGGPPRQVAANRSRRDPEPGRVRQLGPSASALDGDRDVRHEQARRAQAVHRGGITPRSRAMQCVPGADRALEGVREHDLHARLPRARPRSRARAPDRRAWPASTPRRPPPPSQAVAARPPPWPPIRPLRARGGASRMQLRHALEVVGRERLLDVLEVEVRE